MTISLTMKRLRVMEDAVSNHLTACNDDPIGWGKSYLEALEKADLWISQEIKKRTLASKSERKWGNSMTSWYIENFNNLDSKAIIKVAKALEIPVNVLAQFCDGVKRSHEALDENAFGFDSLLTPSDLVIQAQYSGGSDKVEVTIKPKI